jgi:ketosteroid isomerase-like protein
VLDANSAFYEAFEGRDLDAMSDVWEHSDRITCTHPGWSTLRGWGAVSGSFLVLFRSAAALQFILTDVVANVTGDVAWVTLDENLLGDQGGGTVAALNLFARAERSGRWRMVVHQGSPVALAATELSGP